MAANKRIRKGLILGIALFVILALVMTLFRAGHKRASFKFAEFKTGTLKTTITSSGILQPCNKVEVGTPISGTFSKVYKGYNDVVKKGDILAEIDARILTASKQEAEAVIIQIVEKLVYSREDFRQKEQLYASGYLPRIEYLKARSAYYSDSSTLMAAKANLLRANTTLEYARIDAPIGGTVIECNAEEGQTVVSNFNTPVLFVIAQDLSEMEIHATVDESDISFIHPGQQVEFSVLAYPDSLFYGTVKQIRLRPNMIQNVVNYIVVIKASNPHHLLLPGMTATIDFIVQLKKDVMVVPKSAFDFFPPADVMKRYNKSLSKRGGRPILQEPGGKLSGGIDQHIVPSDSVQLSALWYIDERNELNMEMVETGSSDDNLVEVTHSENLREGTLIITGIIATGKKNEQNAKTSNQLMNIGSQPNAGGPPPPPGGP